ncbi:hypothetical protein [Desulfolucanica intricata]|uniref:hypothetical protein n=1 Tax=Desulfolucanica intricata TaxID=1285191 RepID=UPI0008331BA2|nr:hypothetical protein [Desulfolucanica intricata]
MFRLSSFLKRFNKKKSYIPSSQDLQVDEAEIQIGGVSIKVTRRLSLDVPHEITAIIPRVEIRRRKYNNGQLASEDEMILNSITIVHAPRHPLAEETPPQVEPEPNRNSTVKFCEHKSFFTKI